MDTLELGVKLKIEQGINKPKKRICDITSCIWPMGLSSSTKQQVNNNNKKGAGKRLSLQCQGFM